MSFTGVDFSPGGITLGFVERFAFFFTWRPLHIHQGDLCPLSYYNVTDAICQKARSSARILGPRPLLHHRLGAWLSQEPLAQKGPPTPRTLLNAQLRLLGLMNETSQILVGFFCTSKQLQMHGSNALKQYSLQ